MPSRSDSRARVIGAITAPLGFFVLALLIVESFLATALVGARLNDDTAKMKCVWIGVVMFILVLSMVFVLVWWKVQNLVFDTDAHMRLMNAVTAPTPAPESGAKRSKGSRNALVLRALKELSPQPELGAKGRSKKSIALQPGGVDD